MRTKLKKIYSSLILFLFGLFVAMILGEIIIRISGVVKVEDVSDITSPHSELLYIPNPNPEIGYDERGFPNKVALDKADIVVIGDSHTGGAYVDGQNVNWAEYLAETMDMDIYNFGVSGYGPVQYLALMDDALSLDPDIIILGFYPGNDYWDAYNMVHNEGIRTDLGSHDFINDNPLSAKDIGWVEIKGKSLRDFLRKHSDLYTFMAQQSRVLREHLSLAKPRTIGTTDWNTDDPDVTLLYNEREEIETKFWPTSRLRGIDLENKNIIEGQNITQKVLVSLIQMAKEADVDFVIVQIPSKETVYSEIVGSKSHDNQIFLSVVRNERRIMATINDICKEYEIVCADLANDIPLLLFNGQQVYPEGTDGHATPGGYESYGNLIYGYLKLNSLVL